MTANAEEEEKTNRWENIGATTLDEEMAILGEMEAKLSPLSPNISDIRTLISKWHLCHFKSPRRLARLIYIIGAVDIEADLTDLEQELPFAEDTNLPQRAQLIGDQIAALKGWLDNRNLFHYMPEVRPVAQEVYRKLGKRSPLKDAQVEWLLTVLPWGAEEKLPPGDFTPETRRIYEQISETLACAYSYFQLLALVLDVIGRGIAAQNLASCATFDEELLYIAQNYYLALWCWLHPHAKAEPLAEEFLSTGEILGERSETKLWLTASLAKTIWGQLTPFEGGADAVVIERTYNFLGVSPPKLAPLFPLETIHEN